METRKQAVELFAWDKTTLAEQNLLGRLGISGGRYAIEADYQLHARACAEARLLVEQSGHHYIARRSWGTLKEGLHWKATFAAIARGERALYVKYKSRAQEIHTRLDEFTPVVFLFSDENDINRSALFTIYDPNRAQRQRELAAKNVSMGSDQTLDSVYSVCGTNASRTEAIMDGHLQRESITALAFLYTGALMGVERYEAITRRPPRFQCRVQPDHDPEFGGLPNTDRIIAWAVRYARDLVIVVAPKGWRASSRVAGFARTTGVKVVTLPLSTYRLEFVERLRRFYFTSKALKKRPNREQIIRPFVE